MQKRDVKVWAEGDKIFFSLKDIFTPIEKLIVLEALKQAPMNEKNPSYYLSINQYI